MTRPSCHHFRSNEVRLWLSVIAYNLGNLWRSLALPNKTDGWSLASLQQRLVKAGGRLIKHARYYWLLLAESHLTRRLFGAMARRRGSKQAEGRTGMERCMRNRLKSGTSGFSRTRRRESWTFPGPPESLGVESMKRQPSRKRLGLHWKGARMPKWKSSLRLRFRRGSAVAKVVIARELAVRLCWKLREARQPSAAGSYAWSPGDFHSGPKSIDKMVERPDSPGNREGSSNSESWPVVEDRIDGWWKPISP